MPRLRSARQQGLTLVQFMIAIGTLGVLLALAASYGSDALRRRAAVDATRTLESLRDRLEQFHRDNHAYGGGGSCGVPTPPADDRFSFGCSSPDGSGYTLTATGRPGTLAEGFVFSADQTGRQATDGLPSAWSSGVKLPAPRWIVAKGG